MDVFILLLIIIPLITAFLIPLIDVFNKEIRKFLVLLAAFLEVSIFLIFTIDNFEKIMDGNLLVNYHLGGWLPPLGITITMDMLAFYFSALISFSVMFAIIYSIGYIGHHEGKYYVLIFILWSSMQGIVLTGDMFNFYVFIELILVSSSALIAFNRNRRATEAAIKYMIYGIIGGLFIFVGVLLLYLNLGTLNFADVHNKLAEVSYQTKSFIAVFFLIGFSIKLGIFPFHFWVAEAQSAAPSPISALLSGIVEKIYIYAFIRMFWFVFGFDILQQMGINNLIIYLALFSSMIGHLLALYVNNIKKTLAYSTIGHLGIIIAVLTLNTKLALLAGLLHVLGHLLMKISLFTATGYILQFTPGSKREDLKGVAYKNMLIYIGFTIVAGGMIGLPPMIGFASKWYMLKAFLSEGFHLGAIILTIGSIFAFVYYIKYIISGFKKMSLGPPEKFRLILTVFYRERVVTDVALFFIIAVLVSGIFFKVVFGPIEGVVNVIQNPSLYIQSIFGV
ncbi:MAG TPA: proton-conducting transporter membrane subunit [Halanaerobiales bacterium]|nr:proton-conducting transporter membrane subunit [Halanaerobiales bacterium]